MLVEWGFAMHIYGHCCREVLNIVKECYIDTLEDLAVPVEKPFLEITCFFESDFILPDLC